MREFKKYQIENAKNAIEAKYRDYDTLLEYAAKLLLTNDDAWKVVNELSISNIEPVIVSVSAEGKESKTSASHMVLKVMASIGNEFAIEALDKIYPELKKGRKFKPQRNKGSIGIKQKHINELYRLHPQLIAKVLMAKADPNIIGDMKEGTFANKLSIARKQKN